METNRNHITDCLKKHIDHLYFNDEPLSEQDLSKSRRNSIFEGCTSRAIVTMCSGPFLAGLARYLGADDRTNGVIGAIPSLAGIIMILSPLILERLKRRKFLITYAAFFSRILLSLMFFLPLLSKDTALSLNLLIGMFLVANLSVSFISPAVPHWIMSITPQSIRGAYFGKRESIVLGFVAVVTLAAGRSLDLFRKTGSEHTGFMTIFAVAIILTVANFVLATFIKEPEVKLERVSLKVKELFALPLRSRVFRKAILLTVFWNLGFQFSAPFASVYMVSGLKLDYTFITISTLVAAVASVVSARTLGKLADKKSWLFLMGICVGFQIASQAVWFFVNRNTALLLVPVALLLGGAALGGINISLSNIQYLLSPPERKTVYMGFSSAVGGLMGFFSSILGAVFMGCFNDFAIGKSGFDISNFQMMFGISGLFLLACVLSILFFWQRKELFHTKSNVS